MSPEHNKAWQQEQQPSKASLWPGLLRGWNEEFCAATKLGEVSREP